MASPSSTSPSATSNLKLFRFPVRPARGSSSASAASSSAVSSILARTQSSGASSVGSADSDIEAGEAALKGDIRSNCIGKHYCKCNHCHIGDFVFDTEDEFLVYYEALKDVLDAKDSGRAMKIHCSETGAQHFTA